MSVARLPKAIIQKYGITKKAWSVFRGKRSSTKFGRVKSTLARRGRIRRRLGRFRGRFRRKKDKRFSIIGTAGVVGSLFAGDSAGHKSLGAWAVSYATGQEDPKSLGERAPFIISDTIAQYTGYSFMDGKWSLPYGTLVLIGSGIAASIAGRFGNKYLKNIPYVGKYIKF